MIEVWSSARIVDLQYHIFTRLQAERFIGPNLPSSLYVLPMQNMPTLDDLVQNHDLALLRNNAMPLKNLTEERVSSYFQVSRQDLDKTQVHFLVWLPPVKGKSLGPIYPIPA
jgi:hypothetical protein